MEKLTKKKGFKWILIIIALLLVLGAGGFLGYKAFNSLKNYQKQQQDATKEQVELLSKSLSENKESVNDSLSTAAINLAINGEQIKNLDLSQRIINVEAPTLHTGGANIFTLAIPDKVEAKINGKVAKNGNNKVLLKELNEQGTIKIELKNKTNMDSRTILIPMIPKSFPTLEISGDNLPNLSGAYYGNVERHGDSYIYKLGVDGKLKYYYHSTNEHGSVSDFKKYNLNGRTYYTYFNPVENYNISSQLGLTFGELKVLDENYMPIKTINFIPTKKVKQQVYVEAHDSIMVGPNHYILFSEIMVPHKQKNGSNKNLRTPYIQEIKNGKVIFEWLASDYPELLDSSVEFSGKSKDDYMHTNSLYIDPKDNNLIISNRNLDSVIKVNRKTGKIMWTLGGKNDDFNLENKQKFARQHYAYLNDKGELLLFNNGNPDKQTSVMKFKLDEKNHKVTEFENYEFNKQFSMYCGVVQQISPDLLFIGWGFSNTDNIASIYNCKEKKIIENIISDVPNSYRIQYFK